jgi:hypothetical protein
MEEQALISQKQYISVKTTYVLAIIFCVVAFLYPLYMMLSQIASSNFTDPILSYFISNAVWMYPLSLLYDFTTFFLLFCMLLAKGTARKTLLLIALFVFFLMPIVNQIINVIVYYSQTYSDMVLQQISDDYPFFSLGMFISLLKFCLNIFIVVLLYRRYKLRVIKPAHTNLLLVFVAAWIGYIIFQHALFPILNAPETSFIPWMLYIAAMALLGWTVFQKTRKVRKKYVPLLCMLFILYIAVYFIVIDCLMYPDIFGLRIINSLYMILPFYFLVFAYKAVSDYAFYSHFIESEPKEIIRAKQYAPVEESAWSQLSDFLRKIFWKNNM